MDTNGGSNYEADPEGRWLPVREAARVLGISTQAVHKQSRRGERPTKVDNWGAKLVLVTPLDEERGAVTRKAAGNEVAPDWRARAAKAP